MPGREDNPFDLTENPRIRGSRPPDHDGIASGFPNHAHRILRRANIAIADHGNPHRLLHRGDHLPVGAPAIPLHARPRMNRNRFDPELVGHARHVHGDDIVLIPAGTHFDRDVEFANSGAHGERNSFSSCGKSRSKPRAAAFHHFFHGQAEVDVNLVEPKLLDVSAAADAITPGSGAKNLRGDWMFVRVGK